VAEIYPLRSLRARVCSVVSFYPSRTVLLYIPHIQRPQGPNRVTDDGLAHQCLSPCEQARAARHTVHQARPSVTVGRSAIRLEARVKTNA